MKKFLGIITLFCLLFSTIGAEYNLDGSTNVVGSGEIMTTGISLTSAKVYSSSEEFLKAEGDTCETATDGCNTVMIVNGELGGMTEMYCEDIYGENGQEEWKCLKTKSDNDMKVCTMEYNPVCGEDGTTYGNACMAGDIGVLYKGECSTYVDVDTFKVLMKKETELQAKLSSISEETLEKAVENIDAMIEGVKISKIAAWGQKLKITQYTFLKRLIENELATK